jgi:hypothetical protein
MLDRIELDAWFLSRRVHWHRICRYWAHVMRFPKHDWEEMVHEAELMAWRELIRLHARGIDGRGLESTIIYNACRHAKCGRTLCSCKMTDALQHGRAVSFYVLRGKHGADRVLQVGFFPTREKRCHIRQYSNTCEMASSATWEDWLTADGRSLPEDIAIAHVDMCAFLASLSSRLREVAESLGSGESPSFVAAKLGVSRGRVSQLRDVLRQIWDSIHENE